MASRNWYLLSYDVRDPRRLARTARLAGHYGDRVQLSVFRLHLTGQQLAQLRWEMARIMEKDDDLMIVPVCARCAQGIKLAGRADQWPPEPELFEVV